VCDRVLIINKGTIVASDTPQNLVGRMKSSPSLVAEIKGPTEAILSKLRAIEGVIRVSFEVSDEWGRFVCECDKAADVRAAIFQAVSANGWMLRELREEKRNLEDVFVSVTTTEPADVKEMN